MDNTCIFINWAVKDEMKIDKLQSGMTKLTLSASSPRPNKNGLWNKNYFTAFGDVADRLIKCNLKAPFYITLTAEQDVYKDKDGKMRNSYILKDFQLLPKMSSNTSSNKSAVSTTSSNSTSSISTSSANAEVEPENKLFGLEELESFMN